MDEPAVADPFDLRRFVDAQEAVFGQVEAELRAGRKTSHWMWFVFPQLRVLGRSDTARRFGLASRAEAQAYLRHPLLGPRLLHCAGWVLAVPGRSAREILGTPDDLKLRSSMTLFAAVAPGQPVFAAVLARFYGGQPDPLTVQALAADGE